LTLPPAAYYSSGHLQIGLPKDYVLAAFLILIVMIYASPIAPRAASGCTQAWPLLILSGPGAACLMAFLLRGFADANFFAQAVSIIAAATIGLALAQSSGRTGR